MKPRDPTSPPSGTEKLPGTGNVLRLNNNEGSWMSEEQSLRYSAASPSTLRNYPSAAHLERAIAERCGVAPSQVMVTAGADDAIDRCFRVLLTPGSELILTAPTFQQFHRFAASTAATIREIPWTDNFPREEIVAAISHKTAMVSYATPNNPTGQIASVEDLETVAGAMPDGWVMLDHAYVEYAEEDLTAFAVTLPNVVVMRTFSKAWGMAGCRVGYMMGPADAIATMRAVGNPYPVSGVSLQIAGERYSRGEAEMRDHVRRIGRERDHLTAFLAESGVTAPRSEANFLFPHFGSRTTFVRNVLEAHGILVRAFPDRWELSEGLRISLPDNESAFARLLGGLTSALNPKAILFDMDGVLADTTQSYLRCIRETVSHFGASVTDEDIDRMVCGGEASNDWIVVQKLLSQLGVAVDLEPIVEHFQLLYEGKGEANGYGFLETPTVSPPDLERLGRGRGIGIVTGRPRKEATAFLRRFDLAAPIDHMVCMEDGPGKPDPAPILRAMQLLDADSAWMVGDSPDDMKAARDAGIVAIGIAPQGSLRCQALEAAGAVTVLPDVRTLTTILS